MNDKYGAIHNDKPRFRAVREWGNKWTLFDFKTGIRVIAKSSNRAAVEDGAEKLNRIADDSVTEKAEMQAIIASAESTARKE